MALISSRDCRRPAELTRRASNAPLISSSKTHPVYIWGYTSVHRKGLFVATHTQWCMRRWPDARKIREIKLTKKGPLHISFMQSYTEHVRRLSIIPTRAGRNALSRNIEIRNKMPRIIIIFTGLNYLMTWCKCQNCTWHFFLKLKKNVFFFYFTLFLFK